tara:strand:+ start:732 stop:908 length:177 start_codon:yes stop_codon:yes gene_type:complete
MRYQSKITISLLYNNDKPLSRFELKELVEKNKGMFESIEVIPIDIVNWKTEEIGDDDE